jgi:hypothetical protein
LISPLPCAAESLDESGAATMRAQIAIFPHPLDACAPFFALSAMYGETHQVSPKSCCLQCARWLLLALSI